MYGTILKSLAVAGATGAAVVLGAATSADLYQTGKKLLSRKSSSESSGSKKKKAKKAKAARRDRKKASASPARHKKTGT